MCGVDATMLIKRHRLNFNGDIESKHRQTSSKARSAENKKKFFEPTARYSLEVCDAHTKHTCSRSCVVMQPRE